MKDMKRGFLLIAMAAVLCVAMGCEKEEYARTASLGTIRFSPSNPVVGDTVTMTVEVLDPGHRIFHADYFWSIRNVKNDTVKVTAPDGSKTITAPPTYKYVFKKDGSFSVNMSAKFKFSMATEQGSLFGTAISKTAVVNVAAKQED